MLRIIKSGFTSGGHERIKEEILGCVSRGERALLVVPEQQTVMAEAEMADFLPPSSALIFEVTNFTRLANSTARALGGISGEYCDKTKRSLLMWRALVELSPILSNGTGVNEGLVKRYMNASSSLDGLGITSEDLTRAAESGLIADNRLRSKLSDLSIVHSLHKRLMAEKYGSAEDEIGRMLRKLRENSDYLSDTAVFIEGFTSFTVTQHALISELAKRLPLTVLLYISHASGDSFEYTEVNHTLEKLKRSARLVGSDIKILTEDSRANSDGVISLVGDLIWRNIHGFDKLSLQNREEIRIFEADTPFDECEFIASDIKRRVIAGERYSDFAIVARSADKYSGILDTALSLADIPAFVSNPSDLSSFEAIKLIYSAYAVLRSGFARENVITYAKCAIAGISRDECDELEYYAEKWQISGSRFSDGELWSMNPDGYTTRREADAAERLIRINGIKNRLITPLIAFGEAVKAAKTVRDHAEALVDHLVAIGVPDALAKRAAELAVMNESAASEECGRMWGLICDALDTLVEVSGELEADIDSFVGQLKICFGAADISRIPAHVDEVTVGSADMLRLYGKKHIYLMGVNAGEFPANVTDNSYFTEGDKAALLAAGLEIAPELEERGARELYIFTRALTYSRETLTLSYSAKDTRYKSRERSEAIGRIIRLFDGDLKVKRISELSVCDRLWSAESALTVAADMTDAEASAAAEALDRAGLSRLLGACDGDITNELLEIDGNIIREDKSAPLSLTQSRIDSFNNCPFAHFCRYTLSLTAEEPAEFDARNIGTFIHAILENVFRELTDEDRSTAELTAEERVAITTRAAEKYIAELGEGAATASSVTKIKISRLVRASLPVVDGLCDEFSESRFKPRFFELAIRGGRSELPDPVVTRSEGGNDILIYGYIDRVDTYERGDDVFVRVVDYKTGAKSFSPSDLAEGKNLQMFLYLKSILDSDKKEFLASMNADGKRLKPAGVVYVKTAISDQKIDLPDDALAEEAVRSAQKREGMVLDDADVISAMGLKYTPLYSARTPDKIPDSKRELMFTEQSLDTLMQDALGSVGKTADRMCSGDIRAVPKLHDGRTYCDSCEYKAVCRSAVVK